MSSSDEEDELLLLLLLKRRKRRTYKKIAVHPLLKAIPSRGLFYTLYDDLREDNAKFFGYFRMKKASFEELLQKIEGDISVSHKNVHNYISAEHQYSFLLGSSKPTQEISFSPF